MNHPSSQTLKLSQTSKVSSCKSCNKGVPIHRDSLVQLGIKMEKWDFIIALAGNPNTGKSTVFNSLTGLRQHTGNWPGKTVLRAEGGFVYREKKFKLIDLPGTYSLLAASEDEEIARNFILFGKPDVTLIVVDATRLERNLNLVFQVFEITPSVVICLNLMDEARRKGIRIDVPLLEKELGVPVVPTAARQKEGLSHLLETIYEVLSGKITCNPRKIQSESPGIRNAVQELSLKIEESFPGLPNARWVALRLLEGDSKIIESIETGSLADLTPGTSSNEHKERKHA